MMSKKFPTGKLNKFLFTQQIIQVCDEKFFWSALRAQSCLINCFKYGDYNKIQAKI